MLARLALATVSEVRKQNTYKLIVTTRWKTRFSSRRQRYKCFANILALDEPSYSFQFRLVIVYKIPYSAAHPIASNTFLLEFSDYLDSLLLSKVPLCISGDCFNWKICCDDHSSLSSTTAVHIWIISYNNCCICTSNVTKALSFLLEISQRSTMGISSEGTASNQCLQGDNLFQYMLYTMSRYPLRKEVKFELLWEILNAQPG